MARAQNRDLLGYKERHHVVPKCQNGKNDKTNLVWLTPEEHFLAHLLLVKIYPTDQKLVYAANMMCRGNKRSNKRYGWLRRLLSQCAKQRTGSKNGSHGKPWYHDPLTRKNGKFTPGTEPVGWVLGRVPITHTSCETCSKSTGSTIARFCKPCRLKSKKTVFKSQKIKESFTREEKMQALIKTNGNIRRALFSLGLRDSGRHYKIMTELKNQLEKD